MEEASEQTKTGKAGSSFWFSGFVFHWALLFSLWIGGARILPALLEDSLLATKTRLLFYLFMSFAFLVIAITRKHLKIIHTRRGFLVLVAALVAAGVATIYLAGFGMIDVVYIYPAVCLTGFAEALLTLVWSELFGAMGARLTSTNVSLAMLGAAVLYVVTMLASSLMPALMLTLLVLFPFLLLLWSLNAWEHIPGAKVDKQVYQQPFKMPLMILIGVFVYGVAFGCMLGLTSIFPTTLSHEALTFIQALGIGMVALLMFAGATISAKKLDLGFTYRTTLPMVLAGFLMLPISGDRWLFLASTFTISGYVYFLMFSIILYADISYRLPASALAVNAIGAGSSTFGTVVGLGVTVLIGQRTIALEHIPAISMTAAFVLILASTFFLNERNVSSLWGLIKPLDESLGGQNFDEACKQIGKSHGLTPREQEVFLLLAKGRDSVYIQKTLTLSIFTVRAHIHNIYEKLGTHTRQDLLSLVESNRGCKR